MSAGTQRLQDGLPPETVVFWKAVAAAFPHLDSLGSWGDRSHQARASDHNRITSSGKVGPHAIDCMTADPTLHAAVVKWALLNRDRYGISLIISRRRKWSASSAWLPRPYFGTSSHNDHVHISNDGTVHSVPPRVIPADNRRELLLLPDGRICAWDGSMRDGARLVVHIHSIATVQAYMTRGYVQHTFDGTVVVTGEIT